MSLNPFALKELRQLTRSRTISGALILFLFTSVLATYLIPLGGIAHDTGRNLFQYLQLAMALLFNVVLPVNVFIRMQKERCGKNAADLTLVTPLPPSAIIDGKLLSAFALIFLFTVAAMPFGVAAYLLHGISFAEMLRNAAYCVSCGGMVVSVTLVIASARCSPVLRVILFALLMLFSAQFSLMFGIFDSRCPNQDLHAFLVILGKMATVIVLLRAAAVALLSPKVMERDAVLRWTVLGAAVGWFAYVFIYQGGGDVQSYCKRVEGAVMIYAGLAMALAVRATAQYAGYSVRQLAARPASRVRGALTWLFRSGAVNGLAFALLLGLAVSFVLPLMAPYFNEQFRIQEIYGTVSAAHESGAHEQAVILEMNQPWSVFVFFTYVLAVLLYVRAFWYFLHRYVRISPVLVPVAAIFLFVLIQTLPSALDLSGVLCVCETSPFCVTDLGTAAEQHVRWSWTALALGLLLTIPETVRALRNPK